jgi:hypothetical protein
MNQRERPPKFLLPVKPLLGYVLFSDYVLLYSGRSSNIPEKRETRKGKKNLSTKKIPAIHFPKSCQISPYLSLLPFSQKVYLSK